MDINKLKQERASKVAEMQAILDLTATEQRMKTDEEVAKWNEIEKTIERYDSEIADLEKFEKRNKEIVMSQPIKRTAEASTYNAFRQYLETGVIPSEYRGANGGFVFRADPLLSTTSAGLINKQVGELSILNTGGLEVAKELGVTILTGLNGTFELNKMNQIDSSTVTEGNSVGSAGSSPTYIEMKPLTYGTTQKFSKQMLLQTPPQVLSKILADMGKANERKILKDLFVNISVDAADASVAGTAAGLDFKDLVKIKAIDYNLGRTSYVTTPSVKGYLEQKNASGAGIKFICDNNIVAGEKLVATAAAKANEIYFGDWSNAVIGIWGEPELIIDPYSSKASGQLEVSYITYADTAIQNSQGFKYIPNASCGY